MGRRIFVPPIQGRGGGGGLKVPEVSRSDMAQTAIFHNMT
jgi:hypothetical protein